MIAPRPDNAGFPREGSHNPTSLLRRGAGFPVVVRQAEHVAATAARHSRREAPMSSRKPMARQGIGVACAMTAVMQGTGPV